MIGNKSSVVAGGNIIFGPVPSRRLGRSLGINNIPPKICSYTCVYCQLGRTVKMQVERKPFYPPELIFKSVQEKVAQARRQDESIDYLAFVPDGEPTLDENLEQTIKLLKTVGIPVAVITNASLITDPKVQAAWQMRSLLLPPPDTVTLSQRKPPRFSRFSRPSLRPYPKPSTVAR